MMGGGRGFTLVELLIGMAIGALVTAGAIQFYAANKTTYRLAEGVARLQENSRFAVDFLRQGIQQAGLPKSDEIEPVVVASSYRAGRVVSTDGNGPYGDSVAVRFRGQQDCLGNKPAVGQLVENHYYVDLADGDDQPSLHCDSNLNVLSGAAPQSIIGGVNHLQALYGIDSDYDPLQPDSGDGAANRYDTMTALRAESAAAPDIWKQIVSVRVAMLMNTLTPVHSGATRFDYALLNEPAGPGAVVALSSLQFNDRIGRQVVTTTVPLRNRFLP